MIVRICSTVNSEQHHENKTPSEEAADPFTELRGCWQTFLRWQHLKETKGLRVNMEFVGKFLLTERILRFLCITLARLDRPTELDRQLINSLNSWRISLTLREVLMNDAKVSDTISHQVLLSLYS